MEKVQHNEDFTILVVKANISKSEVASLIRVINYLTDTGIS